MRPVRQLLLAALVTVAAALGVLVYDCPAACDASPTCQCASLAPPGGLGLGEAPQFILLTNDDAGGVEACLPAG